MRIITSGSRYLDIDAYAGCVAYAEFLRKTGVDAGAVGTAPMNESISSKVLTWQAPFATEYSHDSTDTYTLVDVSEPEFFEAFVDLDKIDEIIDHHPGLEDYWQKRIGANATIERVGAACTQIFERWEQAGLANQMSETSARLLMCGILDNTLNFGALITTGRDYHAYETLKARAHLPEDWPAHYFTDCGQGILDDLATAIKNDCKTYTFKTHPGPVAIGQLAVWNAKEVVYTSHDIFKTTIKNIRPNWFMNAISISEKRSYLISDTPAVKDWLSALLDVTFEGDVAVSDRMWLRKEIMNADIEQEQTGLASGQ